MRSSWFLPSALLILLAPLPICAQSMDPAWQRPSHAQQFVPVPKTMLAPTYAAPSTPYSATDNTELPPYDPAVAVVEFDGNGKLWTACDGPKPQSGWQCQADYVYDFIHSARKALPTGDKLTVITFVHGWTHNAQWIDWNFVHLREAVDCLNWGSAEYKRVYKSRIALNVGDGVDQHLECNDIPPQPGQHFVGIYIGWQGTLPNLHRDNATLGRVFNTALSTADAPEFQSVVRKIGLTAKDDFEGTPKAGILLAGHSMGGLITEKLAQRYLRDPGAALTLPCQSATQPKSVYDLYVLINPAHNSKVGMELVYDFKKHAPCLSNASGYLPPPVVVSIHSKSDPWTGGRWVLSYNVRKFVPVLNFALPNLPAITTLPIATDRSTKNAAISAPPSNGELRETTFNQNTYLLNMCFIDSSVNYAGDDGSRTGDDVCDRVAERNRERKADAGVARLEDPSLKVQEDDIGAYEYLKVSCPIAGQDCPERAKMLGALGDSLVFPHANDGGAPNALLNLYTRMDRGCRVDADPPDDSPKCVRGVEHQPPANRTPLGPWNDTAYWAVNVPDDVITEHSGFWTNKFANFLFSLVDAVQQPPIAVQPH